MNAINTVFKKRKLNISNLVPFGFELINEQYEYQKVLSESGFILTVKISADGTVSSEIIDPALNEPYTLHLTDGAVGSFVGSVKSQYEEILMEIAQKCYDPDVFKSSQAKELIDYVREKYGDELEFLWKKFPDNAVWRRKDNEKWYAALLTVTKNKLGIKSNEAVEIIDLRLEPEQLENLIDNEKYFPGWHMNKKNWYTIILDNSVPTKEICQRLDNSYTLAQKK